MLASASAAHPGIRSSGQFAGSRNQVVNRSRVWTENDLPERSRSKNIPLLTTMVATRDSDLPPRSETARS